MSKEAASCKEIMAESFSSDRAAIKAFDDYTLHQFNHGFSTEAAILSALRGRYPDYEVTVTPDTTGIIAFAKGGQAHAELDTSTDSFSASRMHTPARDRTSKGPGVMHDKVHFGKFNYRWNDEDFIVYKAVFPRGFNDVKNNYVLHRRGHELVNGRCKVTDDLIAAATKWSSMVHEEVLVFDQEEWKKDKDLWTSVQNASWDDVIMDADMKDTLVKDVQGFFDCKEDYKEFAVPWKRGIIFHGFRSPHAVTTTLS